MDDGLLVLGVFAAWPTSVAYKKGERLWFVYRKVGGLQRGGYQQCHCGGNPLLSSH